MKPEVNTTIWLSLIILVSLYLVHSSIPYPALLLSPSLESPAAVQVPSSVSGLAFGVMAAADVWQERSQYIRTWWIPHQGNIKGAIWLDRQVPFNHTDDGLRPYLMMFKDRSLKLQARMCRAVVETFRLGLPGIKWFVIGDDDSVFLVENLVKVLSKYDHTQYHYIGGVSEIYSRNFARGCCNSNMAYGGAGYAISYALAEVLNRTLGECEPRYRYLRSGDGRLQACLAEIGVQLKTEPGFHQLDIRGDASGLLSAHPVAPLLSLHHFSWYGPIFPGKGRVASVQHLFRAAAVDSMGTLQQSYCYHRGQGWSIKVSWGYLVQITRALIPPRELEWPLLTFPGNRKTFIFTSRSVPAEPCDRAVDFFMTAVSAAGDNTSMSVYSSRRDAGCNKLDFLANLTSVSVRKRRTDEKWFQASTRQCCRITATKGTRLELEVYNCGKEEVTSTLKIKNKARRTKRRRRIRG